MEYERRGLLAVMIEYLSHQDWITFYTLNQIQLLRTGGPFYYNNRMNVNCHHARGGYERRG